MRRADGIRGFSLVEVVIAVGVFAVAVTAILILMPTLVRQSAEFSEGGVAQRLSSAVQVEMDRLAHSRGFDALAAALSVMDVPLENGFALVATRDGAKLAAESSAHGVVGDDERFFLIEAWRFDRAPLAYDPNGAVLAVHLRITWPYRLPGVDQPTPLQSRNELRGVAAIRR